jgi:hypothetical protein
MRWYDQGQTLRRGYNHWTCSIVATFRVAIVAIMGPAVVQCTLLPRLYCTIEPTSEDLGLNFCSNN